MKAAFLAAQLSPSLLDSVPGYAVPCVLRPLAINNATPGSYVVDSTLESSCKFAKIL